MFKPTPLARGVRLAIASGAFMALHGPAALA